jgi:D-amino-acid dehydrogenase
MVEMKADTVVLGAGMVGVVATLQLQERGRDVVLTDRHDVAGEESSFGNTGNMRIGNGRFAAERYG